jgi:preprotein translocase subunit SecF
MNAVQIFGLVMLTLSSLTMGFGLWAIYNYKSEK